MIALLTVAFLAAVTFAVLNYCKYRDCIDDYYKLKKKLNNKYIKVDVILRNAVYQALENAEKQGNEFEAKAFRNLLKEIQGKW